MDKHGITILYHFSVDNANHEIFRAKVGKGGIKEDIHVLWLLVIYDLCVCMPDNP